MLPWILWKVRPFEKSNVCLRKYGLLFSETVKQRFLLKTSPEHVICWTSKVATLLDDFGAGKKVYKQNKQAPNLSPYGDSSE